MARARAKSRLTNNPKLLLFLGGILVLSFLAIPLWSKKQQLPRIDRSVSKFMIESPTKALWIDLRALIDSEALARTAPRESGAGRDAPHAAISYLDDLVEALRMLDPSVSSSTGSLLDEADEALIVTDAWNPMNQDALIIVRLKSDNGADILGSLVEGIGEVAGPYEMHAVPGGHPVAISLPEPRTVVLGTPRLVKSVLVRNDYPTLRPRESDLIASLDRGSHLSLAIATHPMRENLRSIEWKAKAVLGRSIEGMGGLNNAERELFDSTLRELEEWFGELRYVMENVPFVEIDINLGEKIDVAMSGECGSSRNARQVKEAMIALIAGPPSLQTEGGMEGWGRFHPTSNRSIVEIKTSFEASQIILDSPFFDKLARRGEAGF